MTLVEQNYQNKEAKGQLSATNELLEKFLRYYPELVSEVQVFLSNVRKWKDDYKSYTQSLKDLFAQGDRADHNTRVLLADILLLAHTEQIDWETYTLKEAQYQERLEVLINRNLPKDVLRVCQAGITLLKTRPTLLPQESVAFLAKRNMRKELQQLRQEMLIAADSTHESLDLASDERESMFEVFKVLTNQRSAVSDQDVHMLTLHVNTRHFIETHADDLTQFPESSLIHKLYEAVAFESHFLSAQFEPQIAVQHQLAAQKQNTLTEIAQLLNVSLEYGPKFEIAPTLNNIIDKLPHFPQIAEQVRSKLDETERQKSALIITLIDRMIWDPDFSDEDTLQKYLSSNTDLEKNGQAIDYEKIVADLLWMVFNKIVGLSSDTRAEIFEQLKNRSLFLDLYKATDARDLLNRIKFKREVALKKRSMIMKLLESIGVLEYKNTDNQQVHFDDVPTDQLFDLLLGNLSSLSTLYSEQSSDITLEQTAIMVTLSFIKADEVEKKYPLDMYFFAQGKRDSQSKHEAYKISISLFLKAAAILCAKKPNPLYQDIFNLIYACPDHYTLKAALTDLKAKYKAQQEKNRKLSPAV